MILDYPLTTKSTSVVKDYTLTQEIDNKKCSEISTNIVVHKLKNGKRHTGSVEVTGSNPVCST